jgi:UDP-N-acetylglucosamine--dolichyl-phosphate N-acetylglucosaminephosphotransferase
LVSLPFFASSLALLYHNWYPSTVFVGDTFTYTAGMTFAVCAILGKSSKTVMLFFIPQFINFALSLPQLFHLLPCPRHRMPAYVANTDKLHFSTFEWRGRKYMNLTLPNTFLALFGDMNEQTLSLLLILFQVICSLGAFAVRYFLAGLMY